MEFFIFLGVLFLGVLYIIAAISGAAYTLSGRRDLDEYMGSDEYKKMEEEYDREYDREYEKYHQDDDD